MSFHESINCLLFTAVHSNVAFKYVYLDNIKQSLSFYLPSRFKVNQSIAIDYQNVMACRERHKRKRLDIHLTTIMMSLIIVCVNCCCAAIEKIALTKMSMKHKNERGRAKKRSTAFSLRCLFVMNSSNDSRAEYLVCRFSRRRHRRTKLAALPYVSANRRYDSQLHNMH